MVNIVTIEVVKADQIAKTIWQIVQIREVEYNTFIAIFLREIKPDFSPIQQDSFQS